MQRKNLLRVIISFIVMGSLNSYAATTGSWKKLSDVNGSGGSNVVEIAEVGESCSVEGQLGYTDYGTPLICLGGTWISRDDSGACFTVPYNTPRTVTLAAYPQITINGDLYSKLIFNSSNLSWRYYKHARQNKSSYADTCGSSTRDKRYRSRLFQFGFYDDGDPTYYFYNTDWAVGTSVDTGYVYGRSNRVDDYQRCEHVYSGSNYYWTWRWYRNSGPYTAEWSSGSSAQIKCSNPQGCKVCR